MHNYDTDCIAFQLYKFSFCTHFFFTSISNVCKTETNPYEPLVIQKNNNNNKISSFNSIVLTNNMQLEKRK